MASAFCLAALVSLSGTISVYKVIGQVTDANGNGIEGATVSSSAPPASATTLSQGYYILSFPTNGTGVTITASYQGHSATSSPIDVTYVPQQVNIQITDVVIPTVTPTPTASPTATPAPTPGPNSTATPTPNATVTPTPTSTPTPTATPTPIPTASPAASPAASPTPTATPSPARPQQPGPANQPTAAAGLSKLATPAPTVIPIVAGPSATPMPSPVALSPKAQSPGFAALLAMGCLLGAAYMKIRKE